MAADSSLCAPTRLLPPSDLINFTGPLRAINLRNARIKESVLRSFVISRCMALTVKQVNITPYRFKTERARFTLTPSVRRIFAQSNIF